MESHSLTLETVPTDKQAFAYLLLYLYFGLKMKIQSLPFKIGYLCFTCITVFFLPMYKGVVLYFKKLNFPSTKDNLCKIWLKRKKESNV